MKTLFRVLAGLFLLAVFYLIVADGMMTCFDLSRGIQYAFNFGAIFFLIPFTLYYLLGRQEEVK